MAATGAMFDTGESLPVAAVPEGSTLLCVGPPMAGKRQLALRLLATDTVAADATVLISTDSDAAGARAEYERLVTGDRPRVGVVDCTGGAYVDRSGDDRVHAVSTPSDLGAIGSAATDLLDADAGAGDGGRVRLGLVSLTSLALNSGRERILRFVRALTGLVRERDGFAVLTAHAESFDRADLARVRDVVDGVVAVREVAEGVEVRVTGLDDAPTEWTHVDVATGVRPGLDVPTPSRPAAGTNSSSPPTSESASTRSWSFDSLADLIDQVESDRPTLTVCNREGPDEQLAAVESFFDDLDVPVRETELGTNQPRDVAMLHRGPELVAASSLPALASGVAAATAESNPFAQRTGPDVLDALDERVFGARGVGKEFLIDASTAIEMAAWRTGEGRLLAGFQELSRYWGSPRSRRVVDRIADAGVDVTVFGAPDVVPSPGATDVTVRPDDADEIADSWFVAYDGGGRPDRARALVVRESEPDVYHGFWTYDPALAGDVFDYLGETYRPSEEDGRQART